MFRKRQIDPATILNELTSSNVEPSYIIDTREGQENHTKKYKKVDTSTHYQKKVNSFSNWKYVIRQWPKRLKSR